MGPGRGKAAPPPTPALLFIAVTVCQMSERGILSQGEDIKGGLGHARSFLWYGKEEEVRASSEPLGLGCCLTGLERDLRRSARQGLSSVQTLGCRLEVAQTCPKSLY